MKRKLLLSILLAVLMALMMASSALAGDKVELKVNGDPVASSNLYLEDGVSFVTVEAFARFSGADINWISDQEFEITENNTTLSLAVGKKEAMLGAKPVALPAPPVSLAEGVFVPLRFVSSAFGFEVSWDAEKQQVLLSRNETRDSMTPSELLAKSNQAVQNVNTYSMAGNIKMAMNIESDGKKMGKAPLNMATRIEGQLQAKPMQAYMKMSIAPAAKDKIQEVNVETYMTEKKMYIKAAGQEWTVQDMPFPPEFLKQQQDIQSDPLKAVAQMKELGILLNYGNDLTIDGQEYYVINANMDMNKFRQGYQKIVGQMMLSMPAAPGASPEEAQKLMQRIMDRISMDYYYTVYINKKTLISDVIKLNARIEMAINPSEFSREAEAGRGGKPPEENLPQEIKMNMAMQGDIKIDDLGKPFTAPDVSKAKEMTPPAPEQKTN